MERIYFNGPILTLARDSAEAEKAQMPEALAVKDGKIRALGSLKELRKSAGRGVRYVDLQGRCLMPAFIDGHSHFFQYGRSFQTVDLSRCESYEAIIRAFRDFIQTHHITPSQAVYGRGYDLCLLPGGKNPDKTILDQVSTEIPILANHISGHMCCGNTAALRLAGITRDTVSPANGRISRMPDGEPSGHFEEGACGLISGPIGKRLKYDDWQAVRDAQRHYLSHGITTAQDGGLGPIAFEQLKKSGARGQLKIDVVAYTGMGPIGQKLMAEHPEYCKAYVNHVRLGGYKIFLDGSPQARTAWMSQPYLNGPADYCGYGNWRDAEVEAFAERAIREGKQLLAHCNGDAASEQYVAAYERALKKAASAADLRPVMIHCQTVRNDQLDRMARLPMIASIFVGHVWYWGDVHMQNFGPDRGRRVSPVADALKRGLHVTFHQDSPVTEPDMLHSIWCAVNRISRSGVHLGPEQQIGVYDALRCAAREGAYQYGEENEKGTLEAGKRADMIILDHSPLDVEPLALKDLQVLETIKDGATLYRKP